MTSAESFESYVCTACKALSRADIELVDMRPIYACYACEECGEHTTVMLVTARDYPARARDLVDRPRADAMSDAIRDKLILLGWSYAKLASMLGFPPQYMTDLVLGRRPVGRALAARLGSALFGDVDVGLILSGYVPERLKPKTVGEARAMRDAMPEEPTP